MKKLWIIFFCISFGFLNAQETAYYYIVDGNDDGYEIEDVGVYLDREYLEMYYLLSLHHLYILGLRFQNVTIPPGAEIVSAYVQFTSFEANDGPNRVKISCQDHDNPSPFEPVIDNIKNRASLSAYYHWDVPSWDVPFIPGPDQRTPDIKESLQKIIDRPGWVSGNPIVFIMYAFMGYGSQAHKACSWEYMGDMYAPVLEVTFNDYASVNELAKNLSINMYPNPVTNRFTISLTDIEGGQYNICIYDMKGNIIHQIHDGLLDPGDHKFEQSADDINLYCGIYLLSIRGNQQDVSRKLIIQ